MLTEFSLAGKRALITGCGAQELHPNLTATDF